MTHNDYPTQFGEESSSLPSVELQEQRLQAIQAQHMIRIVSDRDFFTRLRVKYPQIHDGRQIGENSDDISINVYGSRYSRTLEDGSREQGQSIYVGFRSMAKGYGSTNYVQVADRVDTPEGRVVRAEDEFTDEQGKMLAEMLDDLVLAKVSGEIPDLTEAGLNRVYIASTANENPYQI